jgi:hypothetical protein
MAPANTLMALGFRVEIVSALSVSSRCSPMRQATPPLQAALRIDFRCFVEAYA